MHFSDTVFSIDTVVMATFDLYKAVYVEKRNCVPSLQHRFEIIKRSVNCPEEDFGRISYALGCFEAFITLFD